MGEGTRERTQPGTYQGAIHNELQSNEQEAQNERDAIQEESKPKQRKPELLTIPAREFKSRARPIHPKLIPHLGGRAGGKLGLYGPGGSGKSYTFLNMAVAAAQGEKLLGLWSIPRPLRVAFISLEDPAQEQLERLNKMLPAFELEQPPEGLEIFDRDIHPAGFVLAGRGGKIHERAFKILEETVGDLDIDLLMIEPKGYMVECSENDNSENIIWQKKFHEILERHKTLAFVGHHAGWSKDGAIHARGATAFRDWVDGMVQQTADTIQGQPGFLLTCNKSNFAPRWEPLALLFNPDTGHITAADETLSTIPHAFLEQIFNEHGGAIVDTQEDIFSLIAERAACSTRTARRAVEQACSDGWLKNEGRARGFRLIGKP